MEAGGFGGDGESGDDGYDDGDGGQAMVESISVALISCRTESRAYCLVFPFCKKKVVGGGAAAVVVVVVGVVVEGKTGKRSRLWRT